MKILLAVMLGALAALQPATPPTTPTAPATPQTATPDSVKPAVFVQPRVPEPVPMTGLAAYVDSAGLHVLNSRVVSVFAPAPDLIEFENITFPDNMQWWHVQRTLGDIYYPSVDSWPPAAAVQEDWERRYRIPFGRIWPDHRANVSPLPPSDTIGFDEFMADVASGEVEIDFDPEFVNPYFVKNEVTIRFADPESAPFPVDVLCFRLWQDPYTRLRPDAFERWPSNNWHTFKWAGTADLNTDGLVNQNDIAYFWRTMNDYDRSGRFDSADWTLFNSTHAAAYQRWRDAHPPIDNRVNINAATQAELETLPGVGPTIALRIIAHRSTNGPFETIEEIMDVRGIGQSTFDNIKDLIVAGPPAASE